MAKAKKRQEVILNEEENALGFLDFQAPDEHLDAEIYSFLQWNNGAAAWEFPLDQWGGSQIDQDHDTVEVIHNFGQDTEPGMLVDIIHISVVAQRVTWEKEMDGKRVYSPHYEDGMRKRYNFLCLIKETDSPDLAIITARSYTGSYIQNAIKQHKKSVLKLASRMAGGTRFPLYMFWLPLCAGEKIYVGGEKKSEIQPPSPAYSDLSGLNNEGAGDLVKSLYIGDDLRGIINDYLFGEGQSWTDEHQRLLPAPSSNIPPHIEVLPGNVLYFPDLSAKKPPDWIEAAMTIEGLFQARPDASNAFAKMSRKLPRGTDQAAQWEAWRNDLERRYKEMVEAQESVALEAQLQNGG